MPYMDDLRLYSIKQFTEFIIYLRMTIPVFILCYIDDMNFHTRVRGVHFLGHLIIGKKTVLLPGKDVNFVSMCQRLCKPLGIYFGTGVIAHGVAMNNQEDLHCVSVSVIVFTAWLTLYVNRQATCFSTRSSESRPRRGLMHEKCIFILFSAL